MTARVNSSRRVNSLLLQCGDPRGTVTADGEELRCEPMGVLPMAQRYFLF
jgi:urease alpha subunit